MNTTAPTAQSRPFYILGLDLGQASDFSALSVIRRTLGPDPEAPTDPTKTVRSYGVVHLHRWPLSTPYTRVVMDVANLGGSEQLQGMPLVVDSTGCGKPVVDMFRASRLPLRLIPIVISAGHQAVERDAGGHNVPNRDLVGAMLAIVQARRFHIAPGLPEAAALGRELQAFRVKVLPSGEDTFEALRAKDHDDMILSCALGVWYGETLRQSPGAPLAASNAAQVAMVRNIDAMTRRHLGPTAGPPDRIY